MIRKSFLVLAVLLGSAGLVGCPTGGTGGNGTPPPSGDPQQPVNPTLSINASRSILQTGEEAVRRSALLEGVLGNADPATATFEWSFTVSGAEAAALGFGTTADNATATAEGASVSIVVTRDLDSADEDVTHIITLRVTLEDGDTLSSTITIIVQPDPLAGGESTLLALSPFADPPVGVDDSGQITLNSNVTGARGTVAFEWDLLGDSPEGLSFPVGEDANDESLLLTVDPDVDVSGVYTFRVTATDAENAATATVNVFIGVVDPLLDVRPTRIQLEPTSAVDIQTLRAGGFADLDAGAVGEEDNTFTYEWQILDASGNEVTIDQATITLVPDPTVGPIDAPQIDWEINGLEAGAYRFLVTVTDQRGGSTTGSAAIILTDELGVTAAANLDRVPVSDDFRIRTVRGGGEPPFTYQWTVIDQDTTAQTGATTFAPANGSTQAGTTTDWVIGGFDDAGVYQFFLTVTDGAGLTTQTAATIAVGDVLTLDVRADENIVQPLDVTNLRLLANGGIPPYVFTLTRIAGSGGGTPTLGAGVVNDNDGAATTTWTAPAAAFQGSYSVDVVVEDAEGRTARDNVWLIVDSGGGTGLSLDVRATRLQIGPVASAYDSLLRTNRQNGVGPDFDYTWTVIDSAGADATGDFTIALDAGENENNAEIDWDVTVGAGVTAGTHNFIVEVEDVTTGDTFISSQEILVANILSVDVRLFTNILAEGMPMPVQSVATGGVANFTHTLSAQDSQDFGGMDFSGIFSDGMNPSTLAGNTASEIDTFYPSDGVGAYRITANIRDALETEANATATVFVTGDRNLVIRDAFTNPIDAQADLSAAVGAVQDATDLPDSGNSLAVNATLTNPRNLTIRVDDQGTGTRPDFAQILVNGTNARGDMIQEEVDGAALVILNAAGNGTAPLRFPFATVTTIQFTYADGDADDTVEIGVGERFGLSGKLPTASDAAALAAIHLIASADANLLATNPEQAVFDSPEPDELVEVHSGDEDPPMTPTTDQQYIVIPAADLDGLRDFFIQFGPVP